MDERKKLKLNIQRTTTILIAVVFLLSVAVSAAKISVIDDISLVDLPFDIVNNGDGTETVIQSLSPNPYWDLYDVPLVGSTGVFSENPFYIEITGDEANADHLITGYMWPMGYLDIDGIAPNGFLDLSYSCDFLLYSEGTDGGQFATQGYVAFVPRYRLLDENYNQIAMVTGSTNRYDFNTDPEAFSQSVSFDQTIHLPEDTPVRYIELKWRIHLYLEPVYSDWSLEFNVYESSFDFTYLREHVLTDSELAAKLNDEVGKISDDLSAAGDAFDSVPKPSEDDLGDVMKPVDQLVDQSAMNSFTEVARFFTGSGLVSIYLTIMCSVVMVSYILFGKKA